jgi:hypothetical protein
MNRPLVPIFVFSSDGYHVIWLRTPDVMFERVKKGFMIVACAAFTFVSGCSGSGDQPEVGEVSGIVTLDGKPVAGVNVVFKPDVGRAGAGNTDAEGRYTLQYLEGVEGTKLGPNTVSFDWPIGSANAVGIPAKYNDSAAFKFDVKPGSNTFDLKMESDGSPAVKPLEQ